MWSKLKIRYLKRYLKLYFLWREINQLSFTIFSIWSCSIVMYEPYFSCNLKRNPLSEMKFSIESKIRVIFNVLRTWDYPHFLTYIFRKLKRNYLTKWTLTIHHCTNLPPPSIMALKTADYLESQISANVCKSYCSTLRFFYMFLPITDIQSTNFLVEDFLRISSKLAPF